MKKWILMLLVVTCAVFCALGIAACVPEGVGQHIWSGWKYDAKSEQGLARGHWRVCEECGLKKDIGPHEFVPMEDHIEDEPTCGEVGYGWLQCTVCKLIIVGDIPATGDHDWGEPINSSEATCGVAGSATYQCSVCNAMKTDDIPATGEHTYTGGAVRQFDENHQLQCVVCNQWSDLLPHNEGEEPTKITKPVGKNDGSEEWTCADCGHVRKEDIVNPNVPNKLDVKLSFNNQTLPMTDHLRGKKVQMYAAGVGDKYIYNVELTATYPDGTTEKAVALTLDETGDGGVRAYYQLPTFQEEWITPGNSEYFTYGGGSAPLFRAIFPGNYTVIFRYETGYRTADENRVRAEFYLYVESVNATASTSAMNLSVVDDGLVCLATGAYESKSY